jgi:hypothetical protein
MLIHKPVIGIHGLKFILAVSCLLAGSVTAQSALAFSPENDLMQLKGYSPEVIQLTGLQRNRQEWKEAPAPKLSPTERFFHNIYYGDWTGDIDQFGSSVLREK